MMEIEFGKNPKCEVCKKEIDVNEEEFMMKRKNGKDKYVHAECYAKLVGMEIKRVLNSSFDDWKSPIDKI